MSNRRKIIIILVGGLAVIGVIFWYFFFVQKTAKNNFGGVQDENAPVPVAGIDERLKGVTINKPTATAEEKFNTEIKALAKTFLNRYGTFSNQNNYVNFAEVSSLMTDSFRNYVFNDYLKKLQMYNPADGYYYEIKTEPLVITVQNQTIDEIELLISSAVTEKSNDEIEKKLNRDATITLKKVNDNWLVDGVYWKITK